MDLGQAIKAVTEQHGRQYGIRPRSWGADHAEAAIYIGAPDYVQFVGERSGALIYRAHPQDKGWLYKPSLQDFYRTDWYVTDWKRDR